MPAKPVLIKALPSFDVKDVLVLNSVLPYFVPAANATLLFSTKFCTTLNFVEKLPVTLLSEPAFGVKVTVPSPGAELLVVLISTSEDGMTSAYL